MRLARAMTVAAAGVAAVWFLERRRALAGAGRPGLPGPSGRGPRSADGPQTTVRGPQTADHRPQTPDHRPQTPDPSASVPAEVQEPDVEEPEVEEAEVEEPEPEPEPEPEAPPPTAVAPFIPSEQPTREQPAIEREGEPGPVDVTAVVDDLIAPRGDEDSIVDAEVVEDEPHPAEQSSDERIAQAVRDELARVPGLTAGAVGVEVTDGTVFLRGKIDRPGTISELDRRVRDLDGVVRLRNLLHLPGTPPPL